MKTSLKRMLQRNAISLKEFCKVARIKSYEDLVYYCKVRELEPVSSEELEAVLAKQEVLKAPESSVELKDEKSKSGQKRSRSRKGSSAQKD